MKAAMVTIWATYPELFITVAVLLALGHSRLVLVIAFHVGWLVTEVFSGCCGRTRERGWLLPGLRFATTRGAALLLELAGPEVATDGPMDLSHWWIHV